MTEAQFQRSVIELAQLNGWRVFHARKAQNAKGAWRTPVAADGAGFPDLVLVRDRVIFAELKTDKGRVSPAQREWLDAITDATTGEIPPCDREVVRATVWRPRDWPAILAALNTRETSPF